MLIRCSLFFCCTAH